MWTSFKTSLSQLPPPSFSTLNKIGCLLSPAAFNGVPDLNVHTYETNPGHLILSWGQDSASFYTIAYELINRGHCQPITSPKRVLLPDLLDRYTTHFILTGLEPDSSYRVYVQSHYGIHSIVPVESHTEASTLQANGKA